MNWSPGTRTASVVIIGGGVIGTCIAYHLAARGLSDVLVLERDRLGLATCFSSSLLRLILP